MYNPSYFGSSYSDPSPLYNKALPRPTSSGTLERDAKRPKINRPSTYYFPNSPQGPVSPGPYYSPRPLPPSSSLPYSSDSYWNPAGYSSSNVVHTRTSQPLALPPRRDSQIIITNSPKKENIQEGSDVEDDLDEFSQSKRSTSVIHGTSITLATEEDIKQWREERRKMWLLKISNRRKEHMEKLGVSEEDLKDHSVLRQNKKQKQFIQNIQNQVNRTNPKSNLDIKLVQRETAHENVQLLQFIKELGDSHLLEYKLTAEEKLKLFGSSNDRQKSSQKSYTHKGGSAHRI